MDTRDPEDLTADAKDPTGATQQTRTPLSDLEPTVFDDRDRPPTVADDPPPADRSQNSSDVSGTDSSATKPERFPDGRDQTVPISWPQIDECKTVVDCGAETGPVRRPVDATLDRARSVIPDEEVSLGPYVLVGKLGQGGMGIVYLAWDRERNATVALKFLPRVDPMSLYRFKREFRAHADLTHRNLIKLYELFSRGDRWFYTMEHVVGLEFRLALQAGSSPAILPLATTEPDPSVMAHATLNRTPSPPTESVVPPPDLNGPHVFNPPESGAGLAVVELDWLRALFEQLAHGLNATHEAGLLHRDIKSSNVMVGTDGRVVILDFGLVTDLVGSPGIETNRRPIVGTIETMSPEQARGDELTAASDWYSVGVMLYEALTGQKPFVGTAEQILNAKQRATPRAPTELRTGIPRELSQLCMDLLAHDPKLRPDGREFLARLGGRCQSTGDPVRDSGDPGFVGRRAELSALETAYDEVSSGRTAIVVVAGPSGAGKSSLTAQFLSQLALGGLQTPMILSGRCYEQESVPFKAIDTLVDRLADSLDRLTEQELEAILPPTVDELAQVFPILSRVGAIKSRRHDASPIADPHEMRRRAIGALRFILSRFSEKQVVVLTIDDLHWGDVDSAQLLIELLLPPNPPRILLIATCRDDWAETSECLKTIRAGLCSEDSRCSFADMRVDLLAEGDAHELAAAAIGGTGPEAEVLTSAIVREAQGNPYFLLELARQARDLGGMQSPNWQAGKVDLDAILVDRVGRLPGPARRLLELIALAGQPIPQHCACRAADLNDDAWPALMALRHERLVRSNGLQFTDAVMTSHDRIREAVVGWIDPPARREYHGKLANVLEEWGRSDFETLASHFLAAGDDTRAGNYYETAADRAAQSLAFERAARLYDLAHAIRPLHGVDARLFQIKYAQALSNAGRGAEAGAAYAHLAEASSDVQGRETKEFWKRAAYEFTISGKTDEGLAIWRTLLASHGLKLPDTPRSGLMAVLTETARLKLGGMRVRLRGEIPDGAQFDLIDMLTTAATGLGMIEPLAAHAFRLRGLRLALCAGEPTRIAVGLASFASILAYQGSMNGRRIEELRSRSDQLVAGSDDPYVLGLIELNRGFADFHLMRLQSALDGFVKSETLFLRGGESANWELDTCRLMRIWTLVMLGETNRAIETWEVHRHGAAQRGDLYARFTLEVLVGSFVRVVCDEPEAARLAIRSVMSEWSQERFQLQHWVAIESESRIDRYVGDGNRALDRLASAWPAVSRSMAFRSQLTRCGWLSSRATSAVMAAQTAADPRANIALARRDARRLARENWQLASAWSESVLGSVEALERNFESACAHIERAMAIYGANQMRLPAAASKRKLGEIKGGDEGRALIEAADRDFAAIGARDPVRTTRMLYG